jgi:hypothetical protein
MERARPSTGWRSKDAKARAQKRAAGVKTGCVKMVCCRPQAEKRAGEIVPPTRTRVRASRRMRTSGAPLCFETHRSGVLAMEGRGLACAATLLNMRAGEQRSRRSRARDRCVGETNLRVCRARSHCSGIVITMKIPTQSCEPSARGAGTRSSGISRCCASGREVVPVRLIFSCCLQGALSRRAASAKRASGLCRCLLGQAPELKSFGVDCLFDRVARELMGWSLLRPDGARCGPRTQLLWKPAAREIARESLQTFPRFRFENINPHDSTLSAVNDTYVCVAGGAASAARRVIRATLEDVCSPPEQRPPAQSRRP